MSKKLCRTIFTWLGEQDFMSYYDTMTRELLSVGQEPYWDWPETGDVFDNAVIFTWLWSDGSLSQTHYFIGRHD